MRFSSEKQALDWLTKKTSPYRIENDRIELPKGESDDKWVTEGDARAISYLVQEHGYRSAI